MTEAKLSATIFIVVIFVAQIKGQQSDLENNLKLLLSNGLRSQSAPKTGQVIITSNANQNSNSFSDPTLQRQLNFQQQIPLEVLNNLQFANGQQIVASKAQPPLGIVNLVNGKLSPGSASDTSFITACPYKGAQGGISLGNSINIKDLSSLTNQPIILTEILGDKGQPSSFMLQLVPNSSVQNSNGPLRYTLGVEAFQNLSPATVQLTQNGVPMQGNLFQSRSIPCTGSSKISFTQSQLPTGQQSMGSIQIIPNGGSPNLASLNLQNPISTQNVFENSANPLNGYSHLLGNANFDSGLNNLPIASGFTPQSLATSPMLSQFLNQNPDIGSRFSLPPATSDGYQSPERPHQKSKSSLKTLLPLLVNILREKYTCCPNCKCNNCNKNKPEISSGYSNKATFSPNSEDIKAIINKAEDVENSINSDLKSSKKKSGKFKKAIDSDDDYDYENSYEDED